LKLSKVLSKALAVKHRLEDGCGRSRRAVGKRAENHSGPHKKDFKASTMLKQEKTKKAKHRDR
jgi:hypothetical protein